MKPLAALAAVVAVPLLVVGFIVTVVANQLSADTAAAATAAVACTYGDPDPARIALTMQQLSEPVDQDHYDQHAADAGIDPTAIPYDTTTAEQRTAVLNAAIRSIAFNTEPRTVATPVIVWWHGSVPDDDDTSWQDTPVPGYGNLGDYIGEYLNEYAINDVVLASITTQSCAPGAGRCLPPDHLDTILATIRTLESGGNYQAEARGSSASGAYQFVDGTWNNFAGYSRAVHAPPAVQDQEAAAMILDVLAANGNDVAAVPVVWYLGHLPAPESPKWDTVPAPNAGNVLTPREYQTRWVDQYLEIAGPDADTCPAPEALTNLAGPDCDGLQGTGATYNGKVNGTLTASDLPPSPWGPLQPGAAAAWTALADAAAAAGFTPNDLDGWSGGPGSRNGGYSNHTIGLAIDINQLAWTPTRTLPGEPLPVPHVFDQPLYQWLHNNAWTYGWCNPAWARPHYLNGSARGGKDAAGHGNHLEPWHWEYAGGSDHHNNGRSGDLNGPNGIPD